MTDREMYDRLLELAGECRHEWIEKPELRRVCNEWTITVCAKCGLHRNEITNPIGVTAAVGDGREMDLGEMVRLWAKLRGNLAACTVMERGSGGWIARVDWLRQRNGMVGGERTAEGTAPELALGRAIVAAAEGK